MKRLIFLLLLIMSYSKMNDDLYFNDIKCYENVSYAEYWDYSFPVRRYFFIRLNDNGMPIKCLKGE